ncbi:hypothetical protein FRB99_004620, partial [Tulasnella sp. 403]
EEHTVRKSLLQLYTQVFPLLSPESLLPHAGQFLLHTISALSSIFADIRIDAISFLDLLMEHVPQVFVREQQRVLDAYLSLLNLKSKVGDATSPAVSAAAANLSSASKSTIFKSLIKFLRVIIASSESAPSSFDNTNPRHIPIWFLRSSFVTEDAYHCFVNVLREGPSHKVVTWQEEVDDAAEEDGIEQNAASWAFPWTSNRDTWSLDDLQSDLKAEENEDTWGARFQPVLEIGKVVHSLLISTFLDIAPGIFISGTKAVHTGSIEKEVEVLWAVGTLASLVYGSILRRSVEASAVEAGRVYRENLKSILDRMAAFFPFGVELDVRRDLKSEQLFNELNLAYCEMSSLLVLIGSGSRKGKEKAITATGAENMLDPQLRAVGDWVVKVLRGE